MNYKVLIPVVVLAMSGMSTARADEIYKWTDKGGKTHYSTKPTGKGAEKADLPEIMRGEVKLPTNLSNSCKEHAGIDCQAGADKDGSVICNDGFLDSAQRYVFTCSTAKLEVASVSEPNAQGGFSVHVRNSKSVTAEKPMVMFKLNGKSEYQLSGPEQIKAYEVAEYIFDPESQVSDKGLLKDAKALNPSLVRFELACANCP